MQRKTGEAWLVRKEDTHNLCARVGVGVPMHVGVGKQSIPLLIDAAQEDVNRPRGPMDKASAYGAGDCRFESCRGHCYLRNGSDSFR